MTHLSRTIAVFLLGLLPILGTSLAEDVVTPIDQTLYYGGTPGECRTRAELERSTQADFREAIPPGSGSSAALLYFAIGVHIEPHREYLDEQRYRLDRERLRQLAELVERHGGRLTIQAQSPFTEEAERLGDPLFRELAARGHELALHFHEDFHIPNANSRPVGDWIAALRREIEPIARLSREPVRTWSGGNLYQHLFEAAAQVGLEVNINYKDPRTQQIDARFMALNPWRPAGAGSIEERTSHDPQGPIIYLPSGVYPAHCPGAEAVPHPYNYAAFDYVTVALRNSLDALAEGRVNTFIATVHPGDFARPEDDDHEFAVWEEWLTRVIDPLVASGRLRWATAGEMAEAFSRWERAQAGIEGVPVPSLTIERDIAFAMVDGVALKLDAYRPGVPGPLPAIILVHGGGWVKGDKSGLAEYARFFAELGYVGFSVNYRLAPEFRFPAQIEDLKCAVRWVREHAAEYGVDPERIGAFGTSAGGHLVGLLGVTDGSEGLEGTCGDPAISSRVGAVVPYFGPMDLERLFSSVAGAAAAPALLGTSCDANPEACRAASPITYVTPDDPPFLLVHGTRDPLVPFEQSTLMLEALQTAGVQAELVPIAGAGHGWPLESSFGQQALAEVVPFFERHLQGSTGGESLAGPQAGQCTAVEIESVGEARTFVTWLPSEAAPEGGIAVRVIYPNRPRYPHETAAVVEVSGADEPGSVSLPLRALQDDPFIAQGLIHVLFAFPGGGEGPLSSGGIYDHRGLNSLKALRDLVRFLDGELKEQNGCAIGDLVSYEIAQIGLIGSSNGGNTSIVAMGLFGDQMGVDWYVGWENPAGMQFVTVDLGSRDQPNPAYLPGSCRLTTEGARCDVDYTKLRWDEEAMSRGWGPQRGGERGVLYHDLNGNNRYDGPDYLLGSYTGTFGATEKRVYSTPALEAATALGLLDPWPEGVATLEEAREFWRIRDMSRYYDDVIAKLPRLRAIVLGSQDDHVQETPDYPHIVLQYQGWQEAGMEWVRLNPDAAYIAGLLGRAVPVVDNDANTVVDYTNIAALLEPEVVSDPLLQLAAVLELSDRTDQGSWEVDLDRPLDNR